MVIADNVSMGIVLPEMSLLHSFWMTPAAQPHIARLGANPFATTGPILSDTVLVNPENPTQCVTPQPQRLWQDWADRAPKTHRDKVFELVQDLSEKYFSVKQRLSILQDDFLELVEEGSSLRSRFAVFQKRVVQIENELAAPGRFPKVSDLEIEIKRLQIMYDQMREWALVVSSGAFDGDEKNSARQRFKRQNTGVREDEKLGSKYAALVNRPTALAGGILLRPHQQEALQKLEDAIELEKLTNEFSQDGLVIGMPTGSGKTRLMIATIAMGIKKGWIKIGEGDKIIVTTHLKTITDQNIKTLLEILGPATGRDLKISHVSGSNKTKYGAKAGYDGDVVVVSIPTFARNQAKFEDELSKALGKTGGVGMLLMDEIHHDLAKSWQGIKESVYAVSQKNKKTPIEVGFTGTPRADQKGRCIFSMTVAELVRRRILPPIQIVRRHTQQFINNIGVTVKGDFNERQLESVVNNPIRNMAVLFGIEEQALRTADGKGFRAGLGFLAGIQHANDQADLYVNYFGGNIETIKRPLYDYFKFIGQKENWEEKEVKEIYQLKLEELIETGGIFNRKIKKISSNISLSDLEKLLEAKTNGEIDALVAVVDGSTNDDVMLAILQAAKEGKIETVFNANKLEEGFDGTFMHNLYDIAPTLSSIRKGQRIGRIFRRDASEVSVDGYLLANPARRVIEFFDWGPYAFQQAGRVMGIRNMIFEEGVVYDIAKQTPADEKQRKMHERKKSLRMKQAAEQSQNPDDIEIDIGTARYKNIREKLLQILSDVYGEDVEIMANDLGWEEVDLLEVLLGDHFEGLEWQELQEIEKLLYLGTGYLRHRDYSGEFNSTAESLGLVRDVMLDSLEFYLGINDLSWGTFVLKYSVEAYGKTYPFETKISEYFVKELVGGKASVASIKTVAQALYYKFLSEAQHWDKIDKHVSSLYRERSESLRAVMNLFVGDFRSDAEGNIYLGGQADWDQTYLGLQKTFEGMTEDQKRQFINHWFLRSHPRVTEIPDQLYIVGGANINDQGYIALGSQLLTEAEYRDWKGYGDFHYKMIKIVRKPKLGTWLVDSHYGNGTKSIIQALNQGGVVKSLLIDFSDITNLAVTEWNAEKDAKAILRQIVEQFEEDEFILKGGYIRSSGFKHVPQGFAVYPVTAEPEINKKISVRIRKLPDGGLQFVSASGQYSSVLENEIIKQLGLQR